MFESDDNSLMKKYMHLCSSTFLSPFLLSPPSRMLVHIHWCADSVHKEENFNQHFNCALKLEHILLLANLEGKDVMQCSSYFLALGQLVFFFTEASLSILFSQISYIWQWLLNLAFRRIGNSLTLDFLAIVTKQFYM